MILPYIILIARSLADFPAARIFALFLPRFCAMFGSFQLKPVPSRRARPKEGAKKCRKVQKGAEKCKTRHGSPLANPIMTDDRSLITDVVPPPMTSPGIFNLGNVW